MKIIIVLLVLVSGASGISQPYQTIFGDSTTAWNVASSIPDAAYTDSFYTRKDTFKFGKSYKFIESEYAYSGYLREDTTTGKVWCRNEEDTTEFLIMDLSLAVGDSFYIHQMANHLPDSAVVDSVYTSGGKKYIRLDYTIEMGPVQDKLTFMEGVGTNAGIYYQNTPLWGDLYKYLLCKFNDGQQVYTNTAFQGSCNYSVMGIEKWGTGPGWTISPNPSHGRTTLQFEDPIISGSVYLYNASGQFISTQPIENGRASLKISGKAPGMYYYTIVTDTAVHPGGKWMVAP